MKRNKNKMCVWLTTVALSFAIAWCSNTKTANNETSVQEGISATETSNKSAVKTSDNTVNSTEVTIATGGNTVGERTSKGLGAFDKRRTGRKFSRRSAAAKAYRCKRKWAKDATSAK